MYSYKSYTDEELMQLRGDDDRITDHIMNKYKFLVRKKAKAMFLFGADTEDLIQEGMIGLFKAVRDYNSEHSASFYTFADLCITRQMYSAIEASKRKKHIPLNSYISIYNEIEDEHESKNPQLIETIESTMENNPEKLFLNKEYLGRIEEKLQRQLSSLENDVLMLHLAGNNYRVIADVLDKPSKTVDNALQRIKLKAERILESS